MGTIEYLVPVGNVTTPSPDEPLFPEVDVRLLGHDTNVGAIMGTVTGAMKARHVDPQWIEQFRTEAYACESFDALLNKVMCWVWVELDDGEDD